MVWKAHHCKADGISCMGIQLQLDDPYDITKLIKFDPVPLWRRAILTIHAFLYAPKVFYDALKPVRKNALHNGDRSDLSGVKDVSASVDMGFERVKTASKKLKITINELFMTALSVGMKKLFVELGDSKTKKIYIAMPVNIRWKHYERFEDVKLENAFAPTPVKLGLFSNVEEALTQTKRVTRRLKRSFAKTYAVYLGGLIAQFLLPNWLVKFGID